MTTYQHLATLRRLASDALRFDADEREALLWAAERVERKELDAVREPGGAIEECLRCFGGGWVAPATSRGRERCPKCCGQGYLVVEACDA